jgi:hypothetical protein
LGVTFEIAVEGTSLKAAIKRLPPMRFQAARSDAFTNGPSLVNFRRNAQGQIEALSYGAGRVLNVLFVKQP